MNWILVVVIIFFSLIFLGCLFIVWNPSIQKREEGIYFRTFNIFSSKRREVRLWK